jgi:hypothetical protein
MDALAVVFLVLILSIAVYFALSAIFAVPKPTLVGQEEYKLNTTQVVMNSELLRRQWQGTENTASGATLLFFIWPNLRDRTSQTGNEYATAVNIANSVKFKILTAPDAARGSSMAPAVLEVLAQNNLTTPVKLEIPNIALQRWSAVAVVKQGRRFKVFVNGKLVAANMLDSMPAYDGAQGLSIGDPRLSGKIAFLSIVDYPMATDGVTDYIRGLSDSTFKPYLASESSVAIPSLSGISISCPGGLCGGSAPLANPLEQWNSPYQ